MENAGRRKNIWNDDWENKNRVAAIITRRRGLIKIESGLIRIISRISLNEMERAHTFAISRGEGKIDVSANYIPPRYNQLPNAKLEFEWMEQEG